MVTGLNINISQDSQNIAANKSTITIECSVSWNAGSYNENGTATATMVVNGTTYTLSGHDADFNTSNANSGTEVFWEKQLVIDHQTDGSCTVSVSVVYNTRTMNSPFSATASKKLTTIPRESTVSATDADIESVSTISVVRRNNNYTHTLRYTFGNLSGYIAADGTVQSSAANITATSIPFTIPRSFYNVIPNDPSGECTITCSTYSGNTLIGSAKSAIFTVTANRAKCSPDVSGSVIDVNQLAVNLTGDNSKFIQNFSNAQCTITSTAKNGATISARSIGGQALSGSATQRTINNISSDTIAFRADDSRGYNTTYDKTITLIKYSPPTCSVIAERDNPTDGSATLTVTGTYYNTNFGAQKNALTVSYKIGTGSYIKMSPTLQGNNRYTAIAKLKDLDYQRSYTVTVSVEDKTTKLNPATKTIGRGLPTFDWGENDFAFHVPVSMGGNKISDIAEPTLDNDAVSLKYFKNNTVSKSTLTSRDSTVLNQISAQSPFTVYDKTSWPMIRLRHSPDSETIGAIQAESYGTGDGDGGYYRLRLMQSFPHRELDGSNNYFESFCLPACSNLTQDAKYDILTTKNVVEVEQGGTGAGSASIARSNLGAVSIETKSDTIEGSSDSSSYNYETFTFSNNVKMVTVTAIKDDYCASGTWTSHNSGKINRFYHLADSAVTWDTKVDINGKNVTVTRRGSEDITYVVSAITA